MNLFCNDWVGWETFGTIEGGIDVVKVLHHNTCYYAFYCCQNFWVLWRTKIKYTRTLLGVTRFRLFRRIDEWRLETRKITCSKRDHNICACLWLTTWAVVVYIPNNERNKQNKIYEDYACGMLGASADFAQTARNTHFFFNFGTTL